MRKHPGISMVNACHPMITQRKDKIRKIITFPLSILQGSQTWCMRWITVGSKSPKLAARPVVIDHLSR